MKNKIIILLIIVGCLGVGYGLGNKNIIREMIDEESTTVKVVEESANSVVTIGIENQDVGTGFIITTDGLIVTNKHVVADTNSKYKIIIGKDQTSEVVNIYRDPITDLAIIKINKTGLKPVNLGDSDKIKVGQTVIAIGTALGEFRSTVTKGVVSGLGRGITANNALEGSERLDNVIQTDAAINPGNSGGPLFNSSGEVIGVNVAVNQGAQSIGFALPINLVKESIDNFTATGQFDRPYLGVGYKMDSVGANVQMVSENSPAFKAGLLIGDVIIEVDGKKLIDEKNTILSTYVNRKKIGESIFLKLLRNTQQMEIIIVLEKKG